MRFDVNGLIAGAVVAHQGQVLLVRRRVPEGDLLWQFPAGKVEPGETPQIAAVREAREEAGTVVEPLGVIGEREHPVTGRQVVYVACRWMSGTPWAASPREVAEALWVPLEAVSERIPGGVYPPVWEWLSGAALP
ncbi:NUDIX hydrolase [Streptomyces sp. NPDC056390]|uniref:NUDIX hydrolase n=1 Tax=Streptomyces sp. NPDC056390 TaxID=3345806 RepID=UPI0035E3A8BF